MVESSAKEVRTHEKTNTSATEKTAINFFICSQPLKKFRVEEGRERLSLPPTLFNQTLCGRLDIHKITATTVKLINKVIDFIGLEIELRERE